MLINDNKLTIVSRKSRLALEQASIVRHALNVLYPALTIEIIGITTSGDEILDKPLNKIGGKGLFVSELENFLLTDKADIAVHSMKDVPVTLANGLALGVIMERATPQDAFVSIKYNSLQQLPVGATVGTSSLRRQSQILALRPDLVVTSLRGNVETRLKKLSAGQYDAIILASAGLERLNLTQWIKSQLSASEMLPAVGQGALGIEYKNSRSDILRILEPLNHKFSAACVLSERAMNAKLDGGCQAPIAGLAIVNPVDLTLTLEGLVASTDGQILIRGVSTGRMQDACIIGETVAKQLLEQGARAIINELKTMWQKDVW